MRQHRGRGHTHIDKRRRHALLMVRTAQVRVVLWIAMLGVYALGVSSIHHLYAETAFITILSLLALLLTDWSQYAASSAELAAEDVHHDTETMRVAVQLDLTQIDAEIARLADLQPGPEAKKLAAQLRQTLQQGA